MGAWRACLLCLCGPSLCQGSVSRCVVPCQGSEEQTVVYAVGKAGRQDWQHVYTAVTRGRSRVYVIAEEAHLRSAVSKNNVRRKTRLKHFLQDRLSSSCASPAEGASPSKGSEDSRGPSTPPPASPFPAAADLGTSDVQASAAAFEPFPALACTGRWRVPSSGETNASEDPAQPRGSKRTCVMADESPSKVLMVGVVFSRAQALPNCRHCSCCCGPGRCVSVRAALAVGQAAVSAAPSFCRSLSPSPRLL